MNADIAEFIRSYEEQVKMYARVPDSDTAKAGVVQCLGELRSLGEKCSDVSEFMTRVQEKDLMMKMAGKLSELATASLAMDQKKAAETGEVRMPSVADAALGYHKAYEAIAEKEKQPETCRIYERIFALEKESAHAGEFVRRMAEEKLFLRMSTIPMKETFQPQVANAEKISLPVMAVHNELMVKLAETATSVPEIEYESERLLELNRKELTADTMLVLDLFNALGSAISGFLMAKTEENRRRVVEAYRFVVTFFGVDMDRMLAVSRVRDHVEKVIVKGLRDGNLDYTLESFNNEQKETLIGCLKGEVISPEHPERAVFHLWGKDHPIEEAMKVFRNPQRPAEFQK